ncbi:innexin inx2-like [Amphibalanus amphitrite]|uniref:innexin inx2-like n=1 Tax=Amphibalanus amphitrite TaxID=1232801 RepID=UPI001C927791|nr:innexin inx2-like [Amphibalanus amphitrite]XP_043229951.1 innexin inx2-like [Amphibalanus amphitrite]
MLLGVFTSLYDIIRISGSDKPTVDTRVFQLHYKWTRLLLFVFCIIVSLNSLIGKPIACTGTAEARLQEVMQTYCWITGTFTYEKYFRDNQIGASQLTKVGVGPGHPEHDEKKHITYYQWVPIVLFLQGVLFYVPHWIWKMFEDHRIRHLIEGMVEARMEEKKRRQRQALVVRYLVDSKGTNEWYAYQYVFCEILNFANVILNLALTDKLLGGDFFTLGTRLIKYDPEDPTSVDPSHYTFPKQTKCTFQYFGASGTVSTIDSICILPINIFNEKLYAMLWFWFVLLGLVTGLNLLWRLAMIASPVLRVWVLQTKDHTHDVGNMSVVTNVVNGISFSDFFFVWIFTKNLNGLVLFDFLREYSAGVAEDLAPKRRPRLYPTLPHSMQLQSLNSPGGHSSSAQDFELRKPLTPCDDTDPVYSSVLPAKRRQ